MPTHAARRSQQLNPFLFFIFANKVKCPTHLGLEPRTQTHVEFEVNHLNHRDDRDKLLGIRQILSPKRDCGSKGIKHVLLIIIFDLRLYPSFLFLFSTFPVFKTFFVFLPVVGIQHNQCPGPILQSWRDTTGTGMSFVVVKATRYATVAECGTETKPHRDTTAHAMQ